MKQQKLIARLKQEILSLIETVEHTFLALPLEELNWKENNKQWSALECVEHLNRYNRYYNAAIQIAIHSAAGSQGQEISSTWLGAKFINMMRPENKKKQKTFGRMNPAGSKLSKAVLQEFISRQQQLLTLLDEASQVDLNKGKVPVEFFKLLSLTIGDALQFVVVHEQRHVLQAMGAIKTQAVADGKLITF